jgi:lipid A 3-O-deacylase PagL
MGACPPLRCCFRGRLGILHLPSMMVTIMLTGIFSSLAWAEPMTIVPLGPRIDSANDVSFRHGQPDLVPWAISTLGEAVSIDMGTGPAFFSNYKFGGQDFGGPVQIVSTGGAGVNFIPGLFTEYRLQHFSDAGAYGPYKTGVNMHLLLINFQF